MTDNKFSVDALMPKKNVENIFGFWWLPISFSYVTIFSNYLEPNLLFWLHKFQEIRNLNRRIDWTRHISCNLHWSSEDQDQRCQQMSDRWVTDSGEGAPPPPSTSRISWVPLEESDWTAFTDSQRVPRYKYLATLTLNTSELQTLSGSWSSAPTSPHWSRLEHGNKSGIISLMINVEIAEYCIIKKWEILD